MSCPRIQSHWASGYPWPCHRPRLWYWRLADKFEWELVVLRPPLAVLVMVVAGGGGHLDTMKPVGAALSPYQSNPLYSSPLHVQRKKKRRHVLVAVGMMMAAFRYLTPWCGSALLHSFVAAVGPGPWHPPRHCASHHGLELPSLLHLSLAVVGAAALAHQHLRHLPPLNLPAHLDEGLGWCLKLGSDEGIARDRGWGNKLSTMARRFITQESSLICLFPYLDVLFVCQHGSW